eukprot:scaffold4717_cov274-Pinguiococcus_pyrenoidosus.AAC.5
MQALAASFSCPGLPLRRSKAVSFCSLVHGNSTERSASHLFSKHENMELYRYFDGRIRLTVPTREHACQRMCLHACQLICKQRSGNLGATPRHKFFDSYVQAPSILLALSPRTRF